MSVSRDDGPAQTAPDPDIDIPEYEAEKPARQLSGWAHGVIRILAILLTLLAVFWVFNPITRQVYLPLFLLGSLSATFLTYRGWGRSSQATKGTRNDNPNLVDWALAIASVLAAGYIVVDSSQFFRRAVSPNELDVLVGTALVALVLEAARRTVGWVVPAICIAFLAYGYFGPLFPAPFDSNSYSWPRMVGHNVIGSAGIFGAARSQVCRARTAGEQSTSSITGLFSRSHRPTAGASRSPRSASGRSKSSMSSGHADFACRINTRVRATAQTLDRTRRGPRE